MKDDTYRRIRQAGNTYEMLLKQFIFPTLALIGILGIVGIAIVCLIALARSLP